MVILSGADWSRLKAALDAAPVGDGQAVPGRAAHGRGGGLAAAQRREVARGAARAGAVVEGGAAAHPLVPLRGVGAGVRPPARRRAAGAGRGVHGRHQRARAPEGGRGGGGAHAHALGRSRGGYGTKACCAADARGRALAFALIPGQAPELAAAPALLGAAAALGAVGRVVCDRGYSSERWRDAIRAAGAEPVVPAHPTHRNAPAHDRAAYRLRHRVENLWARLRESRAVATRYDKTAASYMAGLHLAAALDWLSNGP